MNVSTTTRKPPLTSGQKAAETRKANARKAKNRTRALKAWETIRANEKKAKNRTRALKAWETRRGY